MKFAYSKAKMEYMLDTYEDVIHELMQEMNPSQDQIYTVVDYVMEMRELYTACIPFFGKVSIYLASNITISYLAISKYYIWLLVNY